MPNDELPDRLPELGDLSTGSSVAAAAEKTSDVQLQPSQSKAGARSDYQAKPASGQLQPSQSKAGARSDYEAKPASGQANADDSAADVDQHADDSAADVDPSGSGANSFRRYSSQNIAPAF